MVRDFPDGGVAYLDMLNVENVTPAKDMVYDTGTSRADVCCFRVEMEEVVCIVEVMQGGPVREAIV